MLLSLSRRIFEFEDFLTQVLPNLFQTSQGHSPQVMRVIIPELVTHDPADCILPTWANVRTFAGGSEGAAQGAEIPTESGQRQRNLATALHGALTASFVDACDELAELAGNMFDALQCSALFGWLVQLDLVPEWSAPSRAKYSILESGIGDFGSGLIIADLFQGSDHFRPEPCLAEHFCFASRVIEISGFKIDMRPLQFANVALAHGTTNRQQDHRAELSPGIFEQDANLSWREDRLPVFLLAFALLAADELLWNFLQRIIFINVGCDERRPSHLECPSETGSSPRPVAQRPQRRAIPARRAGRPRPPPQARETCGMPPGPKIGRKDAVKE